MHTETMDTLSPEPPKKQGKRFFDIQPPSHYPPSPTSRPVIVDNSPPQPDPMVIKNAPKLRLDQAVAQEDPRPEVVPLSLEPEQSSVEEPTVQDVSPSLASMQPLLVSGVETNPPLLEAGINPQPVVVHHRLQKSRSAVRLFFLVIGFLLLLTVILGLLLNSGMVPPFVHLPFTK